MKVLVAAILITIAGVIADVLYTMGVFSGLPPDPTGAVAACDEDLLAQLKAPSTYKRISVTRTTRPPLTYPEYLQEQLSYGCLPQFPTETCYRGNRLGVDSVSGDDKFRQEAGLGAYRAPKARHLRHDQELTQSFETLNSLPLQQRQTAVVEIVYEAANSYNTPLRDTKTCWFGPLRQRDKYSRLEMYDPTVDVRANTDWSLEPMDLKKWLK